MSKEKVRQIQQIEEGGFTGKLRILLQILHSLFYLASNLDSKFQG